MNRKLLIITALAAAAVTQCSSLTPGRSATEPGHGALAVTIDPNPIMATRVSGSTYDFPFDVRIQNPGSLPVTIDQVRIDVTALGGLNIYSDSKSAADIRDYGYPTVVAAGQTLSYHFAPREEVPDDRLFGNVAAILTASGTDSAGLGVSDSIRVSVSR